ncbi:DUF2721 domain-containing protein [Croceicoccus naphthovorans]|uniref:Uncharacterized protein n=1 Tax=Croceicoccus naphthovorans TaxID=1348774 RepID=A0A0G3XGS2_9SPHN|nr:DUF2721 domain-containing protein [Croceicoccus naphthovorans]AKM09543.1 hypothetical protein AB433_05405 [Croceicoccus naphthovorans]MBB3989704.1 hypothetical protein [Croceicoccus naphthovorans]
MIVQTIQLALAPVFVLVAIGNILNMLTSRLGRVVDRTREMQEAYRTTTGEEHDASVRELRMLARRTMLIGRAQLMMVLSAITIGLTVVMIFSGSFLHAATEPAVALCFAAAIALLLAGLILFLMETRVASAQLRVPLAFLELDRTL